MKTMEIVILEVGFDYLDKIDYFYMEVPDDKTQAVAKAIEAVKDRGYEVLLDSRGGCNEYVTVDCKNEYIAITVVPRVEEGEE